MINELLERYPKLISCKHSIEKALDLWTDTYNSGAKLLFCGNGGSCADCDHIVGELMKGFLSKRPINEEKKELFKRSFPDDADYFINTLQQGIPAISLCAHSGVLSAFANDVAADMIYAQMVFGYGKPGDTLVGISTSGNSLNVVNAMKVAKAMGLSTIALCGNTPCKIDNICDVVIKAPASETYKVQEYHLPIYHYLCAALEKRLFEPILYEQFPSFSQQNAR